MRQVGDPVTGNRAWEDSGGHEGRSEMNEAMAAAQGISRLLLHTPHFSLPAEQSRAD